MRLAIIVCLSLALVCASADDLTEDVTETQPASSSTTEPPKTTTSTSTAAPTTAVTTVAPTVSPTQVPTPSPDKKLPPAGNYSVNGNTADNNVTCVLAEFAAQFVIGYVNVDKVPVEAYLDVVNATVDHENVCLKQTNNSLPQDLVLNFGKSNQLTLTFVNGGGARYVDTVSLKFIADPETFPGFPGSVSPQLDVSFVNQTLFKVTGGRSYYCTAQISISTEQTNLFNVTANFGDVHVDSFRTTKDTNYRQNYECQSDQDVNDMVPIAVGIALLALVVIVLIAYFIGRRRSRRLAYQSV